MGRIEELIKKGKLKQADISEDMYIKEFKIADKDL